MFDLESIKALPTKEVLPITSDTIKYLNAIKNINSRLHHRCNLCRQITVGIFFAGAIKEFGNFIRKI